MYLSRVEIDVNNWPKAKELTQLSAFHNWVEQSFPDEVESEDQEPHLWRIDRLMDKEYLIIVSQTKPDSSSLLEYGVSGTVDIEDYDEFLSKIKSDQVMQFRLAADPSFKSRDGKVEPAVTVKDQVRWLLEQAEKNGFQVKIPELQIISRDWPIAFHQDSQRVRLSSVKFEGKLVVKNVNLFKRALTNGVGLEKTFGMGLMTVIPQAE
ncbi:type I-E CRISPR-associated protein Cas6/Cse3/CasE [Lactobacillus sp. ESL0680]|uniref:type I-E CRISPR-associated protein Cas6/Cse3/CasE n=1 Tax=unclassified Lactobacillus TaxID=2620435 RepID=UPI0023F9659F|nr:type I-E CRISPR-associated protein Cas6/Cse3/CasE [Lactobacillus sp. ESL0680]MDF7668693.1 type I-E CRISPR-associated protein Cas6/Cse3/CasE [Lactobacillus sp. ESL0703]WEV38615.1 type I-E CRISPR-associated protein Cas6/Cse3/CasE [Lactobacillus sp. ESL0680]